MLFLINPGTRGSQAEECAQGYLTTTSNSQDLKPVSSKFTPLSQNCPSHRQVLRFRNFIFRNVFTASDRQDR